MNLKQILIHGGTRVKENQVKFNIKKNGCSYFNNYTQVAFCDDHILH